MLESQAASSGQCSITQEFNCAVNNQVGDSNSTVTLDIEITKRLTFGVKLVSSFVFLCSYFTGKGVKHLLCGWGMHVTLVLCVYFIKAFPQKMGVYICKIQSTPQYKALSVISSTRGRGRQINTWNEVRKDNPIDI